MMTNNINFQVGDKAIDKSYSKNGRLGIITRYEPENKAYFIDEVEGRPLEKSDLELISKGDPSAIKECIICECNILKSSAYNPESTNIVCDLECAAQARFDGIDLGK